MLILTKEVHSLNNAITNESVSKEVYTSKEIVSSIRNPQILIYVRAENLPFHPSFISSNSYASCSCSCIISSSIFLAQAISRYLAPAGADCHRRVATNRNSVLSIRIRFPRNSSTAGNINELVLECGPGCKIDSGRPKRGAASISARRECNAVSGVPVGELRDRSYELDSLAPLSGHKLIESDSNGWRSYTRGRSSRRRRCSRSGRSASWNSGRRTSWNTGAWGLAGWEDRVGGAGVRSSVCGISAVTRWDSVSAR